MSLVALALVAGLLLFIDGTAGAQVPLLPPSGTTHFTT